MASSVPGRSDSHLRLVSDEDALVVPENARPTDESPTVISKKPPIIEQPPSSQNKGVDLSRKAHTPESIVAGLRGRRLAHFELIEPIGVGGMAAVIRARDTQLDRFVALKILPPEMARETDNVHRFHQEARAAAKLDHENIARVFYCGEDQGLYFIAFEFVEGINLRTMLEQRGRIPVAESVRYILQVATGLEHAASRGVVHRDVKPSNIIITPAGKAKLVDMGLARNLERQGERDLTQSGMTLGTFDYISPEQALEPREADSRSDIYSLGCTLYHMLTGIAPTPEGTPAKKLHHHQHLAPVDPRQFNPDIPQEIIVILSKMMEKNPRDRYQRPIHLVQHLVQVARKVGVADDLPEGVLFLDAPLPTEPHSRPFLMIGMALTALVAVVLLLSLAPQPNTYVRPVTSPVQDGKAAGNPEGKQASFPQNGPGTKGQGEEIKNRAGLEQALSATNKIVDATINATVPIETDGIVFKGAKGQRVTIASKDAENNIIHFHYQDATAGIILESGDEIVFHKIKFQLDSDTTPDRAVAAICVRGTKLVKFEKCIFTQKVPMIAPPVKASPRVSLASVLIDPPLDSGESIRPLVIFNDCYFDGTNPAGGGQMGIAVNGAATVQISNCAFRQLGAAMHVREKCSRETTVIDVKNCAALLGRLGPVFRFLGNSSAQLRVQQSVFSRPESVTAYREDLPQPGLIFLAPEASVRYQGQDNIYHNLNSLVERKKDKLITKESEFQKFLDKNNGSDTNSLYFDEATSPFANANPLLMTDALAFQLKPEYHDKYGLRTTWTGKMPDPVNLVKDRGPMPKQKIVDADDGGQTAGVFANLAAALGGAVDGDVIYVKHGDDRKVAVPPIEIKPGISVTLKPFKDHQPILVFDPAFKYNRDPYLFKVQDGKLQVEQMEVQLDPVRAGFATQSVVHLGEAGFCQFNNCTFSLRATNAVALNVVTFLDLNQMVKMDVPAQSAARVEFRDCFVRGKGDLVGLRGCRFLNVDIVTSLIALDGSLLDIDATSKVMPMTQGVQWKMERSTVFTTESLFALRCKSGMVLTETQARIKDCLLASLVPDQPVVFLDMRGDENLKKYLRWECEQNYYANFDKIQDWKEQYPDVKSTYGSLTLPKFNEDQKPALWDATPEWFMPTEAEQKNLQGFGVPDLEKRFAPFMLNPGEP